MSLDVAINLNSLVMIKEELEHSISQAVTEFEAYLANTADTFHLEQAAAFITQVAGTFRLLQYPGAALLADEIAATERMLLETDQPANDKALTAVTHTLFVLPRYLEYVTKRQAALPILLVPNINELRILRKAPMLSEDHFYSFEASQLEWLGSESASIPEDITDHAGRLRHMYQVGLLGIINDQQTPYFAELMLRAVKRIEPMLSGQPCAEIWMLAAAFLQALVDGEIELTVNRKRYLATIEGLFRTLLNKGVDGFERAASQELANQLLFALSLTGSTHPSVVEVKSRYKLDNFNLTDSELARERERMSGPSTDTMDAVIKVIREEIRHAKDILEIASQNKQIQQDDKVSLIDTVRRIADTLNMLNLSGPMSMLKALVDKLDAWQDAVETEQKVFLSAADDLLFIDSALSSLQLNAISIEELNDISEDARKNVIAKSQLAEAKTVVLEEAQAGITLSKRAISSYVESNFDSGHIANIAVTLNTVRGGLKVLNYHRAARILQACGEFINSHITDKNASEHRHQLLETLADALISMEYYLSEVAAGHQVNEKILDVAEESLAALGFDVSTKSE